ncbi:MAG: Pyrimidine-specific ribonucleoside hydrolase RihA [candidate division BRC1 bacterium ADurb.BinA364]|nr:MAG: Pyrimidine-specific ribonucleoside hydrolase RihA [candidate division BRC1 bacterium ADurb.BinA364]
MKSLSLAAAALAGAPFPGARSFAAPGAGGAPTAQRTFDLRRRGRKIPVILDTDIGGDIDDTWALSLMLRSPEFDVRLVVSATGDTYYRAKILARMLDAFGRGDIPIGVGKRQNACAYNQGPWVENYDLSAYRGPLHSDGVGAIVSTILSSEEPVTLIAIGAAPNIAAALRREPSIVDNARFVGMHGSLRKGYNGSPTPQPEANVKNGPADLRAVLAAPWDVSLTPLDTCGIVKLQGEKYRKVFECPHPGIRALMENYRIWASRPNARPGLDPAKASTTLFDTVAIYMALSEELLVMEDLGVRVEDDGMTLIDPAAPMAHCATEWKDLAAFEDLLVQRLTGAE